MSPRPRFAAALCLLLVGCGATPASPADAGVESGVLGTPAVVARWHLHRENDSERADAFLLPWPNDLARDASGRVDLDAFPREGVHTLVRQYLQTFQRRLDGFSLQAAVYFRFSGRLDPASLPTRGERSLDPGASVQLIDIDPASPDRGRRVPVQWYFREQATRYWPEHTLAVAPTFGFPLRPRTRYALVVTTDLRTADGAALRRDRDLDAVLSEGAAGDAATTAARAIYLPAAQALATMGVPTSRVLSMTVFTTQDPTRELFAAADWLRTRGPTPGLDGALSAPEEAEFFTTLRGHFGPNPVFQAGEVPYNAMGSGDFVPGADGVPQVQRTERVRFTLTLPRGEMPAGGYPVAIYAHGTGGDADSFVRDGTAASLAAQGLATLGFDQVFHGERAPAGTTPDLAFFNFGNPSAGRTNNRQAALDLVQCGRFVRSLQTTFPGPDGPRTLRFNPQRVFFFGHSQGGLNGPLWLAAEDGASAAVLSGAAGNIALSLLEKRAPVDLPALLNSLLQLERGVPGVPDELVPLHPIASLLQLIVDPSDPVSYGRYIVREPRAGNRAKHVFQTQGFVDRYAPPPGIAALALSIGLPLAQPVLHDEPGWNILGAPAPALPLRANVSGVTGAWSQVDAPTGVDGHFVIFRVRSAQGRASRFLGSAARDENGVPTLPDTF
jgi:hypothetical protein